MLNCIGSIFFKKYIRILLYRLGKKRNPQVGRPIHGVVSWSPVLLSAVHMQMCCRTTQAAQLWLLRVNVNMLHVIGNRYKRQTSFVEFISTTLAYMDSSSIRASFYVVLLDDCQMPMVNIVRNTYLLPRTQRAAKLRGSIISQMLYHSILQRIIWTSLGQSFYHR